VLFATQNVYSILCGHDLQEAAQSVGQLAMTNSTKVDCATEVLLSLMRLDDQQEPAVGGCSCRSIAVKGV
jgi:hypothetical protein